MAEEHQSGLISQFLRRFIGSIGLMFIPLPISLFKRQLAGKIDREGTLEFYSHPNFICTLHLIWVGWLMTLGELYNSFAVEYERTEIPPELLSWPWVFVLLLTIVVMGLQFGRVQIGFLVAAIAVSGLSLALIEVLGDVEIFKWIRGVWKGVPVDVDWGIPLSISCVLGVLFVCVATWRRLNDRWSLKPTGNYLEHENFQEKDRTISKGAKTFVAVYPCLLRRYLMFGFGDIEVRSSTGEKIIDRIEGVFFARHHADVIKARFGTTDTRAADAEAEEEMEDEEASDEAL